MAKYDAEHAVICRLKYLTMKTLWWL